ncbi:hypothetical protein HS125_18305 [bacterium]|nr:hypothetical protein [bacterium]
MRSVPAAAIACILCLPAWSESPQYLLMLRQDGALAKADIAGASPPHAFQLLNQPDAGFPSYLSAVDLEVRQGGLYILDRRGLVKSHGGYGLEGFLLDQAVARDLEFRGAGPEALMIDEEARGYHLSPGRPPDIWLAPAWPPIRDLEFTPRGERVLADAAGALYLEDAATPFLSFPLRRGDQAEDLEIGPDETYYLLTSHGVVFAASRQGGRTTILPTTYLESSLARALVLARGGGGFWVLDALGVIYAYGNADPVESFVSTTPTWVDLEAVYADDLLPPAAPPPEMQVALLPAAATLSTTQRRVELAVQVEGARDLAGFIMKMRYDPALLAPLAADVEPGADFARVGLDPAIRGPVAGGYRRAAPRRGRGGRGQGHLRTRRGRPPALPHPRRCPVSTDVEIVSFKAIDTRKGAGWVEAVAFHPARLSLRTRNPRTLISLAPDEEVKQREVEMGEWFAVYLLAQDWRNLSGVQFDLEYTGARVRDLGYDEGELLLSEGRPVRLDLATAEKANAERARRRQRVVFPQRDRLPAGDGVLLAFFYKPLETGRIHILLRNVYATDSSRRLAGNSALSDEVVVNVVGRRMRP